MDSVDKRILAELQKNANRPVQDIAEAVGLSGTPCWRRIKSLEKKGIIEKQVALINAKSVNLDLIAFVAIRTTYHHEEWLENFLEGVRTIPEVVEFYRTSGDIDYVLKVVVPGIAEYDKVYKRIIRAADLSDVSASFVMETIKCTTSLPLDYA